MGKQITFSSGKISWQGGLAKVDRDKVYGYVEDVVTDNNGDACTLINMLDDGRTLVLTGATALKTADADNRELDKKTLKTVYVENGKDAVLVPSSYDGEVKLKEVSLDDIYNLEVTAVYQMTFEDDKDRKSATENLEKVAGFGFVFNYRADYEGADAIILAAQEQVFVLTGRALTFDYLENGQTVIPVETEEETSDEVDFGML